MFKTELKVTCKRLTSYKDALWARTRCKSKELLCRRLAIVSVPSLAKSISVLGSMSMLLCVCSAIDHRWRQNVVRKKCGTRGDKRVCHGYDVLTISWRHPWSINEQTHGNTESCFCMITKQNRMLMTSAMHLQKIVSTNQSKCEKNLIYYININYTTKLHVFDTLVSQQWGTNIYFYYMAITPSGLG